MRFVICSILGVAIVGGFLAHRHKDETAVAVAKTQAPQAQVQTASAAPQQNSPHNWMKNSLDRAGDVKKQVAQQRKESGDAYGR